MDSSCCSTKRLTKIQTTRYFCMLKTALIRSASFVSRGSGKLPGFISKPVQGENPRCPTRSCHQQPQVRSGNICIARKIEDATGCFTSSDKTSTRSSTSISGVEQIKLHCTMHARGQNEMRRHGSRDCETTENMLYLADLRKMGLSKT